MAYIEITRNSSRFDELTFIDISGADEISLQAYQSEIANAISAAMNDLANELYYGPIYDYNWLSSTELNIETTSYDSYLTASMPWSIGESGSRLSRIDTIDADGFLVRLNGDLKYSDYPMVSDLQAGSTISYAGASGSNISTAIAGFNSFVAGFAMNVTKPSSTSPVSGYVTGYSELLIDRAGNEIFFYMDGVQPVNLSNGVQLSPGTIDYVSMSYTPAGQDRPSDSIVIGDISLNTSRSTLGSYINDALVGDLFVKLSGSAGVGFATGPGNDYIMTSPGDDAIDGKHGIDTFQFNGKAIDYGLRYENGRLVVRDSVKGRDGSDTLQNIEILKFQDLTINFSLAQTAEGVAGGVVDRIAELYVAFFNRIPDGEGLAYWIEQYKSGLGIDQIAERFYEAGLHFSDLSGYRADMSHADFVNIVYKNVLGRLDGADPEGLAYWSDALVSGRENKGTLVSSILDAAHGEAFSQPDNPYHWVQRLLDNKLTVAKQVALEWGVNYNSSEDSIIKGMAIAAAVTPWDITDAVSLVGVMDDLPSAF